jgi:HK97 family phage major capsid protein
MPDLQTEIKTLVETLGKDTHEFKSTLEAHDAEVKRLGTVSAETNTKLDAIDAAIASVEVKLDRFRTASQGGGGAWERQAEGVDPARLVGERKAFDVWARRDMAAVPAEERKFLARDDASQGGVLAPTDMVQGIVKGIQLYSPIRQFANVVTTSRGSVNVKKRTGVPSARWQGELESRSQTSGSAYADEEMMVWELTAEVEFSQANLEDSAYDIEGQTRMDVEEQFGVKEGLGFVAGTGIKQPEGFTVNPFVTAAAIDTTAGSGKFDADDLIRFAYELKSVYAQNARFYFERRTMGVIRRLRYSGTDTLLWQPGLAMDRPNTLLDAPYTEVPDLPAPNASGAYTVGQYPVAFGDMRRAYTIGDRTTIQVIRDNLSKAPHVRLIFTRRTSGQVVLPDALKLLKVAA